MNISQELYKKNTDKMSTSTPNSKLSLQMSRQVKGSPATLAKLLMKYEKKAKHIEKLKQQLSETKEEEIETSKTINALVARHCDCEDETGSSASLDEILLDDCPTSRGISEVFNEAIILPAFTMSTSFEACMG